MNFAFLDLSILRRSSAHMNGLAPTVTISFYGSFRFQYEPSARDS